MLIRDRSGSAVLEKRCVRREAGWLRPMSSWLGPGLGLGSGLGLEVGQAEERLCALGGLS